jgi:predicted AlkP superfamily phosphohydrolase/phosphomutase
MIALDAAEPSLVERWIADGSLPNLGRLRARGSYGRLASTADWLAGSPWPTFYTSTTPAEHGVYDFLQWRADRMALVRPGPDWLPVRPFWRDVGDAGRRVVAIDLPMTFAPEPLHGVELSGWATHDLLAPPASYPPDVLDWVRRELGRPPMSPEVYGPQRPRVLLQLRDELVRATRGVVDLATALMRREPWDLCMVGFGAPHRGGHKLWDLSGIEGDATPSEEAELSNALRDVYVACDDAVGKLVGAAGAGATVLVFSLHGMGPNSSRADLLPTMLERILAPEGRASEQPERTSLVKRLLALFPRELRHRVKLLLPSSWQDRLTVYALLGRTATWATARAFSLIADIQGYVRINLRGRESAGLVAPGPEYDRLCAEIVEGLTSFVDADTGEPIVASLMRIDGLFADGARRDHLPDLIVRWAESPAARHRAIVSARYGSIPWPTPGRNPDGRSGEHRAEGFVLVAGEGIEPDARIERAHILDLAPTVCALLGVPTPPRMRGATLPGIRPAS